MSLEVKINEQLKEAMKSGDKIRLDTIRSIRAAIIEFNKSGADKTMDEAGEIKLLNSLAKKRKDSIAMYEQANRQDLANQEKLELSIIQEYLPVQLSNDEVKSVISQVITQTGAATAADLGKVMGASMKQLSGKVDGTVVQTIAKELLGLS